MIELGIQLRVEKLQGDEYRVIEYDLDRMSKTVLFQGSIADCEAYWRLKREGGIE
jgi:hypothetical protein